MAAAVLRLLPRRRASLIPASLSSYSKSKPPYPLRAVTAAAGLLDARRAQLFASPVPSMLRLYASEGCARRQSAHHQATCRLHKVSAATTSVLPGSRRMELSLPLVLTPTRHFSSTRNVLPPLRKLIDSQAMQYLKVLGLALLWLMVSNWIRIWRLYVRWVSKKILNDLREQSKMIREATRTLEKAVCLFKEGLNDEAFSMFEQGLDDLLKALAIYEKGLDDLVKVIGSCDELTLAIQDFKITRQLVNELSADFKNVIALWKDAKGYVPRMGSQVLEDV